jgi:hypothetical protein
MKKISTLFIAGLLLFSSMLFAQDSDFAALRKDYPLLMERYGNRLESRNAHYIFAVDISSSMREYEKVVRENLTAFVKAIPENDQVTVIVMCDENNTNYLNSIKCITLNAMVRQSIIQTIQSNQFQFLRNGDPKDGSDGFTMTSKVLEAMNVVNSSDLTFVYLLTDFEYWTHKNRFDKTAEDWMGLKSLLTDKHIGMMCKYGIELNSAAVSHPEAVFKPELDAIFGPLDYQQASSAEILAQWFDHIINEICAHKINAMLKADWRELMEKTNYSIVSEERDLKVEMQMPETDLVSGYSVKAVRLNSEHLLLPENQENSHVLAGIKDNPTFFPSVVKLDSSDVAVEVQFESAYANEIQQLQGLCHESPMAPDAVRMVRQETIGMPMFGIWNAQWPKWVWEIIIGLIALFILSLIWKYLQNPAKRYTNIVVKRTVSGSTQQITGDTMHLPFSVGVDGDLKIPGCAWRLKIVPKRYNPIFNPFRKSGYYAVLEVGDFADVINDITDTKIATLTMSKPVFLFKYKKVPLVRIEITEGVSMNIITLS